jgi:hypothetical protein
MPWKREGSGYTTKRGGFVRNPGQYEKLRAKGMSKERAARITNSFSKGLVPVERPSAQRGRDGRFVKQDGFQMIELDSMDQTEAKIEEVEKADHSGHYFNARTGVVHEFKDSPTHQRARRKSAVKGAGLGTAIGGATGLALGRGPGALEGGLAGGIAGGVIGHQRRLARQITGEDKKKSIAKWDTLANYDRKAGQQRKKQRRAKNAAVGGFATGASALLASPDAGRDAREVGHYLKTQATTKGGSVKNRLRATGTMISRKPIGTVAVAGGALAAGGAAKYGYHKARENQLNIAAASRRKARVKKSAWEVAKFEGPNRQNIKQRVIGAGVAGGGAGAAYLGIKNARIGQRNLQLANGNVGTQLGRAATKLRTKGALIGAGGLGVTALGAHIARKKPVVKNDPDLASVHVLGNRKRGRAVPVKKALEPPKPGQWGGHVRTQASQAVNMMKPAAPLMAAKAGAAKSGVQSTMQTLQSKRKGSLRPTK